MKKDYTEIAREIIRIKESGGGNKEIFDYLDSIGYGNPEQAYYYMRKQLKKSDPELAEQLISEPAKKPGPAEKKEAPEAPEAEPEKKPTAEEISAAGMIPVMTASGPIAVKPISMPVVYEGMTVREVEGLFGRYRYSNIGSAVYIDYENTEGVDVLSLTVDQWRRFREEQEKAAAILGVEL